jgi:LysM repeat protein
MKKWITLGFVCLLGLAACRRAEEIAEQPTATATLPTAEEATAGPLPSETATAASPITTPEEATGGTTATAAPSPTPTLPATLPADPAGNPSPTVCGPPAGWVIYIIQPGDTLFALAQRTGTTVAAIQLANCLPNTTIYSGTGLYLPASPATVTPSLTPTATPTGSATATGSATVTPSATSTPEQPQPQFTATSTPSPTSTPELPVPSGPGDPQVEVAPVEAPAGSVFTFTVHLTHTVQANLQVLKDGNLIFQQAVTGDPNHRAVVFFTTTPDAAPGEYFVLLMLEGQLKAVRSFIVQSPTTPAAPFAPAQEDS